MSRALVLLSGGLDSSTLLYLSRREHADTLALSVLYGQRHVRELLAAERIARAANVRHVVCDAEDALKPIFATAGSSQVGQLKPVPEGHYADKTMRTTIVPNRNMVLLAIAGALAVAEGCDLVLYAAHAGDHPVYPDCRPEFVGAMELALRLATDDAVKIHAPFRYDSKTMIVIWGAQLGVPFGETWSCYNPQPGEAALGGGHQWDMAMANLRHCGRCGTCIERREAFQLAGVVDPTSYADNDFWKKAIETAKR